MSYQTKGSDYGTTDWARSIDSDLPGLSPESRLNPALEDPLPKAVLIGHLPWIIQEYNQTTYHVSNNHTPASMAVLAASPSHKGPKRCP